MNCMKCGRETTLDQIFCDDCLAGMAKYPVDPGTPVQIPRRQETPAVRRTPKRKAVPLEEQILLLKKRIRNLTVALAVCIALILAMIYPSVKYILDDGFAPGQNYSSVTSNTDDEP